MEKIEYIKKQQIPQRKLMYTNRVNIEYIKKQQLPEWKLMYTNTVKSLTWNQAKTAESTQS